MPPRTARSEPVRRVFSIAIGVVLLVGLSGCAAPTGSAVVSIAADFRPPGETQGVRIHSGDHVAKLRLRTGDTEQVDGLRMGKITIEVVGFCEVSKKITPQEPTISATVSPKSCVLGD